jgi:hypothetical protein
MTRGFGKLKLEHHTPLRSLRHSISKQRIINYFKILELTEKKCREAGLSERKAIPLVGGGMRRARRAASAGGLRPPLVGCRPGGGIAWEHTPDRDSIAEE